MTSFSKHGIIFKKEGEWEGGRRGRIQNVQNADEREYSS